MWSSSNKVTQTNKPPERSPGTSATRKRSARSPAKQNNKNILSETSTKAETKQRTVSLFCSSATGPRIELESGSEAALTLAPAHLHLPRQVLVLVPDDGQRRLLAQGVGAVPEGLLRSRRRGRAADLLVAQAVAALVGT